MTQRKLFIISAIITAFVMLIVGAVAVTLKQGPSGVAAAAVIPGLPANLDPSVVAQINQREAALQQQLADATNRLQQANDQLTQAYSKEQDLANQLAQAQQQIATLQQASGQTAPSTNSNATAPDTSQYAVSPSQAAQIALGLAPNARVVGTPQLVNFNGVAAYQVTLDVGQVYVDANSGQVLAAGASRRHRFGGGSNPQPQPNPPSNDNGSSGNTN